LRHTLAIPGLISATHHRGPEVLESDRETLTETVHVIHELFTDEQVFADSRHVTFVEAGLVSGLLVIVFDSPAARGARFAYLEALDGLVSEFPGDPQAIAALVMVHLEEVVVGNGWWDNPSIVPLAEYRLLWPGWQERLEES
jgi:hypothetical protein